MDFQGKSSKLGAMKCLKLSKSGKIQGKVVNCYQILGIAEINRCIKKANNMKISNLNGVPNQFVLTTDQGTYFQSYQSMIAYISKGVIYLDQKYYNYSNTTSKHLYRFLGVDRKEFKANLKAGLYQFADLNS